MYLSIARPSINLAKRRIGISGFHSGLQLVEQRDKSALNERIAYTD